MLRHAAALALTALALASCGGRDTAAAGILISAASDLAAAMPELTAAFEAETGVPATVTLAATGQLASQIRHGAPVDVFLAADASWVDGLAAEGLVDATTRAVYALGTLVLVTAGDAAPPAELSALRDARWRRIALANPEHAPYGRAAHQALQRSGVYDDVADRLIIAENVRQTLQFIETGAVDVAVSALSLMDPARHRWVELRQALHEPLQQTAVVVARSTRPQAAAAFIAFLGGPEGRGILERHRFTVP